MSKPTLLVLESETPAIEGLTFRSIRGVEDADLVYGVRAGCVEHDQVDLLSTSEGLPSREAMRQALAELVAAQRQDQRLVVEVDGQAVGYSFVDFWPEDNGHWVYLILGWVLPAWRGRGLGTAMLHWGEQTAYRLAADEHPGEEFELAANASSTQPESTALLRHEGYSAGYTQLEMGLDFSALPPVHPLPPGVEVRPTVPEHVPLIATSIGEAYQKEYPGGRFQATWALEESVGRLSAPNQNPALWQVAWAGEQVVGNVLPLIEGGRALMHDISVRPAWRRQGLARALLTRALWDLRARGVEVIRLNTIAEFRTRARDLYYSVGFRVLKEFPRYRKNPA